MNHPPHRLALIQPGGHGQAQHRIPVLGRLAALRSEAAPRAARWCHWVLELDHRGRLTLPPAARQMAACPQLRAWSCGDAPLLRTDGPGTAMPVDRRGRVLLPEWLRQVDAVFVAARRPDIATVVVAPAVRLDAIADALVGEVD